MRFQPAFKRVPVFGRKSAVSPIPNGRRTKTAEISEAVEAAEMLDYRVNAIELLRHLCALFTGCGGLARAKGDLICG